MKTFKQFVEEVVANNVGAGKVAGIAPGESPPVGRNTQKPPIIKRRAILGDLLNMMIGAMTTPKKKSKIDTQV